MRLQLSRIVLALPCLFLPVLVPAQSSRPTITLDEYFNTTEILSTSLALDASAAVISTETPD